MESSKNVLVLTRSYPDNNGCVELMYIHTRNLYYIKHGIKVIVLNFKAENDYIIDNINVITLRTYKKSAVKYDVLLLHAPNLRNHYFFLKRYGDNFKKYLFFYHGHEVMKINKDYAKPYDYKRKNVIHNLFQDIYDGFKLFIWRKYLPKHIDKSHFIFVSNWMYDIFLKNTGLSKKVIEKRHNITYNNVGNEFEIQTYNESCEKEYDFITVRNDLDGSKYALDVVNRLAQNTPECSFLVVGKGEFFKHFKKSNNIVWMNCSMSHTEIIGVLQKSRFALMPTRTDAQGLMMCEMAAFGIPVITSDISVCHEVFDGFENVFFIDNDDDNISLSSFKFKKSICQKDNRFYQNTTVKKEVELINRLFY